MNYVIFSVDKSHVSKINQILRDDLVSRQSISVRDASALNIEKDIRYVLIEGTDEAIKKAEELFTDIGTKEDEEEAKTIYNKIKSEESDVAEGVGFIFGD
ncbi:MAG: hypothetical protein JSW28_02525 [Thermoplasmata archaeon]|nr:MAG: hypothetical protein JSW28_02525 [Thermoplasmata archaeon]